MRGDRRFARRHRMRRDAWFMVEGGQRCECALSDISDKGARIAVHDAEAIPDNFLLLLAENGATRRWCRVIWRKSREIGVKFETHFAARATSGRRPVTGAAAKREPASAESA